MSLRRFWVSGCQPRSDWVRVTSIDAADAAERFMEDTGRFFANPPLEVDVRADDSEVVRRFAVARAIAVSYTATEI